MENESIRVVSRRFINYLLRGEHALFNYSRILNVEPLSQHVYGDTNMKKDGDKRWKHRGYEIKTRAIICNTNEHLDDQQYLQETKICIFKSNILKCY